MLLDQLKNVSVATHLPWVISCISIYVMWQVGNLKRHAWIVGLCNQTLWFWWQYEVKAWGLMPLWTVMVYIYARNYLRWSKK